MRIDKGDIIKSTTCELMLMVTRVDSRVHSVCVRSNKSWKVGETFATCDEDELNTREWIIIKQRVKCYKKLCK